MCVRPCACMHACVLVFASASGNVLLSVCACVVLLTENSLERASQTRKGCQNPHTHTPTGTVIINTLVRGHPDVGPI